jgi:hypothetical protein
LRCDNQIDKPSLTSLGFTDKSWFCRQAFTHELWLHRSVSAYTDHKEYADPSVRDMASFAFLSSRLA